MTQVPEVPVTGGTPCLREMTEEDLDTIARLEGELFGAEAWTRGLLNLELEASRGPQADRRYVVAESEGADDAASPSAGAGLNGPRLLGYAGLYHASGLTSADLLTIATIPVARGRGVASLMLTELVSTAQQAGCPDVLLEVRQSNEAAQRLYTGHGFVPIGRRRRYYQAPPEDAVVMRLTLRPRLGPVGSTGNGE